MKREQARPKLKKLHDRSKNKDLDSLTVHQKQRVTFEKRNSGSLALIVIFFITITACVMNSNKKM